MKKGAFARSLTALILVPAVMNAEYAAFAENVSAGAEVKIVSFLRGDTDDLRASELLEARVEGYDGNPRELTYTWTDNLGTFLYVYNSHNMYGIGETDSEIRLGTNSSYPAEVYDITGGGKGFAWAAVSGANVSSAKLGSKLEGARISVTVTDDDGNVIGTSFYDDAFGGNRLSSDLGAGVYGIFEGDTINLKYLLGKGGIVHADCEETTVKSAEVTEGGDCLSIDTASFDVTGVTTGVAQVSFGIEKANCQFHRYGTTYGTGGIGSGSIGGSGNVIIPTAKAVVPVCVFKRPEISTTATTLTISSASVDNDCEYLINGIKGETADDGSVVFTGLTRNTRYEIEVRRAYIADGITKYAYAYVYDDTKPLYRGTIQTHLNGIDIDIGNIPGLGTELYLKSDTSDYIRCVKGTPAETGVYHAALEDGTYYIFVKSGDEYIKTSEQQFIINGENRIRELHYFSVSYDTDGGTVGGGTEIYFDGQAVTVPQETPEKEGYIFKGWKEADRDTLYQPGELLTGDIGEEHALTAQWVKSKDIKVNVEIQHYTDKNETIRYDEQANNDATVDLWLEVEEGTNIYEQIGKPVRYTEDGAGEDYTVETTEDGGNKLKTVYTAVNPIFTNLSSENNYTVSAIVDGTYNYDVASVEKDEAASDEDTDVYNIRLIYDPDNFNLKFNVKMEDEMPETAYPASVTAKVTAYTSDGWRVIEKHSRTGIKVDVDPESGIGTGSCPVPISSDVELIYYRIEIEGAVLHDGKTWVTASDVDNGRTEYHFGRYIGTVSVQGGLSAGGLDAVYCDTENHLQQGALTAEISAKAYTVKYNSNGGSEIADETKYRIPDLTDSKYIPEREEYTFMGWYADEALTIPAVTDTPLENDVTLYAKWKRTNLNISGTVTIDGVYTYNGKTIEINEADHPGSALVLLQEIEGDGYAATIDQVSVIFGEYQNNEAKASYSFTAVNNEKDYRIAVLIPNYNETYQNADTAEGYNDTDYTAIFDNGSAEVNVYLDFVPLSYNQPYEIDTATLGSDYQPENAEIKILYDDKESGTNPQKWPVISQLEETNVPVEIKNGRGSGEYPVWIRHSKIEAEYDYAINILSFDGVPYNEVNMPFRIEYSGTAHYSPLYGQPTAALTAVLRPKVYNITLDPNADGDVITGMDEYYFEDSEYDENGNEIDIAGYYMNHTWSFKTPIDAKPQRDGYVFKGWQYKDEIITEIPADICENIVLTAVWEQAGMTAVRGATDISVILKEARQGVIAAAQYDAYGVLLAVNTTDTDTENTVYNIELSAADCAYIKVMLWDSLEAMTPLYNAVIE